MKRIFSRLAICAGLCAVCVAGSAIMGYADTEETAASEEGREHPQDDGSVRAKIVSLSGTSLTVYLEEKQEPPTDGTAPADGETPPEKPEGEDGTTDGTTPPEPPTDADGTTDGTTPPEPPADGTEGDGTTPPEGGMGHGGMGANFSEETTTLTVSSSTTVTEGMDKTSSSLSALEADDIVRIVLDDDGTTVVSIDIMDMTPPETESSES